jgi:hypothetical protein
VRRFVTVGVIAAVLGLAACGGDDDGDGAAITDTTEATDDTTSSDENTTVTTSDAGSSEDVDACALVSEDEVSAIIGIDVITVPQANVSGGSVCHWEEPDDGFYTVRLTIGPASLYETLRSNVATDLDGLGDEAWSAFVGEVDIGVRVGEYHVLVFFDAPDDMSDTEALERGVEFTEAVLDGLDA